jgi:hypothetical protein
MLLPNTANSDRFATPQENDIAFAQLVGIHPPAWQRFTPIFTWFHMARSGTILQVIALDDPKRVVRRHLNFFNADIESHDPSVVLRIVTALDFAQPPGTGLEVVRPDPLASFNLADRP